MEKETERILWEVSFSGYVYYSSSIDQDIFWGAYNSLDEKCPITVSNTCNLELIPRDVPIIIDMEYFDKHHFRGLSERLGRFQNVTYINAFDYEVQGYKGNARFRNIRITDFGLTKTPVPFSRYNLDLVFKNEKIGFDCNQKMIDLSGIIGNSDPSSGFFYAGDLTNFALTISKHVTNFSTILIPTWLFKIFYDTIPEVMTNPNIIISIYHNSGYLPFDIGMFDGRYLENIMLTGNFGEQEKFEWVDRNVYDIKINSIIEYDPYFEEFVKSVTRYKKTKSARY